jgi:hypothetical protein
MYQRRLLLGCCHLFLLLMNHHRCQLVMMMMNCRLNCLVMVKLMVYFQRRPILVQYRQGRNHRPTHLLHRLY